MKYYIVTWLEESRDYPPNCIVCGVAKSLENAKKILQEELSANEKWLKENDKEYEVNKAEKQVFINDIDGDFCYTIEIQECEGEI